MLKKTSLFIILFLLINFYFYSTPKPKDNNVGALVGKIYIELNKDWDENNGTMPEGKYYLGEVHLVNKDTNKKLSAFTNLNGCFYFLNLEPGNYLLLKFDLGYNSYKGSYSISQKLGSTGIDALISSNKITVIKTIKVLKEILPKPKQSGEKRYQPMTSKFFREDNSEELKAYFKKLDFQKQWKNFEFQDELLNIDENFKTAENYRYFKKDDKAIEYYTKSIESDNKNIYSYYDRGLCFYDKKKYNEALEDFNKTIESNEYFLFVITDRGDTYYYQKNYDKAIADYLKSIELYPENSYAYRMLGDAYENKGDLENARKYLNKAKSFDNISKENFIDSGNIYLINKQYDKALEEYYNALYLDNKYIVAYYNIGNTYFNKKKYNKAKEYLLKALKLNPNYALANRNLGRTYEKLGNNDKAIEYLSKAIELENKVPDNYYYRGIIYAKNKKFDEALNDFDKAIECDNKYSSAYSAKASFVLCYQNKFDQAIDNLNKAIEINPKNGSLFRTRSILNYSQNDLKNAFQDIEKALTFYDKLSYADFYYLIISYKTSKEAFNNAMWNLKRKINSFDDAWVKDIGDLFAGKINQKELLLLKFESLDKNEKEKLCEAYFYIGMKNLFDDKKQEAADYFKKCIDTDVFYYFEYIIAKKELRNLK